MKKKINGKIKLSPLAKDKSNIPVGLYCYTITSISDSGTVKTKVCPYYISKKDKVLTPSICEFSKTCEKAHKTCTEEKGQCIIHRAGCSFLDIMDNDEDTLLWDMCKECNIKV